MFPKYILLNLYFFKKQNRTILCIETYLFEIHCLREKHILIFCRKCICYSTLLLYLPFNLLRSPVGTIMSLSSGDRQKGYHISDTVSCCSSDHY